MRCGRLVITVAALLAADPGLAQEGQSLRVTLPPQRPFDLDLEGTPKLPPIIVPPAKAPARETPAAGVSEETPEEAPSQPTPATDGAPVTPPAGSNPPSPVLEEDEDEGPVWPKLTPGQKAGAEPQYDPNEKAERPGISTDPGTSVACLPKPLKEVLGRVAEKYGAVKVTSTWRPAWRARRNSYHRRCEAMDFRVPGVKPRLVLEWVRGFEDVGGHHVYWNGLIHVDTGPRRPW
ncbi:Peptidase M15 [Bosea sp. TND4EK4]|nr:Peptidase M15 [Bosea sp. TND4EK4]